MKERERERGGRCYEIFCRLIELLLLFRYMLSMAQDCSQNLSLMHFD